MYKQILLALSVLVSLISFAWANGTGSSDLQQIIQLIIDSDKLAPYYHEKEIADRKPLKIVENKWLKNAKLSLTKFNSEVEFISDEKKGLAYLVFDEIKINAENASVRFRYPIEGIRGDAVLEKHDDKWILKKISIVES